MSTVSYTQQIYSREVLQSFIKKLAPISAFSVDASPSPEQLGTVVKLAIIQSNTVAASPGSVTNYEIDGSELDEIDVTLSQVQYVGMGLTDRQLVETQGASILQMQNAYQSGSSMANAVLTDIFTAVTAGNFPNTTYTTLAHNAFTYLDVAALLVAAENLFFPKNGLSLVIGPTQFYSLLSSLPYNIVGQEQAITTGKISGVFGLENIYCSNILPSGFAGFLAVRDALAVAFRHVPAPFASEYQALDTLTDENGVTIGFRRHYSRQARKTWDTYDTLYGYTVANSNAIITVTNHS